jgi:hypothetical protein
LSKSCQKSCQKVVKNFGSPGKNQKKVNPENKNKNKNGNGNGNKKKKIIGIP